jgi:hypothetical protein
MKCGDQDHRGGYSWEELSDNEMLEREERDGESLRAESQVLPAKNKSPEMMLVSFVSASSSR